MCQICRINHVNPEYETVLHEVDENKWTNNVFFDRHKDLSGKKLVPGQPGYQRLASEWVQIRNEVRPLINLIPTIEKYRGSIPLPFILGWIKVESGGNISVIPKYAPGSKDLNERGYFQISIEESDTFKFDHTRLTTDKDYSIQCGIALINHYMKLVKKLGINESNPLFWHFVKLWHAASGVATRMVRYALSKSFPLVNWDSFKEFSLRSLTADDQRRYAQRLFNNVDHLFKWASTLANTSN